jgi:hypothetical protein
MGTTNFGEIVYSISRVVLLVELEDLSATIMHSTEQVLTRDPGCHGAPAEGTVSKSFEFVSCFKTFEDDTLSISCENEGLE